MSARRERGAKAGRFARPGAALLAAFALFAAGAARATEPAWVSAAFDGQVAAFVSLAADEGRF